ncbi:MAG: sensor histidine kinase [Thioalkalivibrio sp.]
MLNNLLSRVQMCDLGSATGIAMEIIDGLPWPALVLDEAGTVVHVNEQVQMIPGDPAPVGLTVCNAFPDLYAQLAGDVPWLTSQDVSATLKRGQRDLHLTVHVRRFSGGSYILIKDETKAREQELHSAQTARLASLGFMLAGVCHEVSNPLAATYSMVQILQSRIQTSDDMVRKGLDNIATNVRRILEVSARFSDFSRVVDERMTPFNVSLAIEEALSMLGQGVCLEGVTIQHTADPGAKVVGRVSELRQVFFNILLNGVQALDGEGQLVIDARHVEPAGESDGVVLVTIRDNGPGIAEAHLSRIFEPFFTTKRCGDGTGLGLAISYEILQEHEGSLRVENHPEGGACFTTVLPLRKHAV